MDNNKPTEGLNSNLGKIGLDSQLVVETSVMCDYAMTNGYAVPARLITRLSMLLGRVDAGMTETEVEELAALHQRLNRIVSPSTPQALVLIQHEKQRSTRILRFLGAVPILRQVMLITLLFLFVFVLIAQSDVVNQANLEKGILNLESWDAVVILLYLISCAGLGACFTSLYRLNEYVSQATYDPRYDSTYWTAIILGVIAGVFISELLYYALFDHDIPIGSGGDETGVTPGEGSDGQNLLAGSVSHLGKPALALLGGFSANMVYKVLQRTVDSIESLFKGDQKAIFEARRAAELSHLRTQQDELQMEIAQELAALERDLDSDPAAARESIRKRIEGLLVKK